MVKVKKGETAPDFCLKDTTGKEICLSTLQGKWVVLYFYPKDNTHGCTIEAIDFTKNLDQFRRLGAIVLGVSPDSVTSHQKFVEKNDLEVTLLSDETKSILEKYGVWQEKSMYGKSFMGVVRSTFLIDPNGKIAELWEKVKVTNHVANVLQRLQELQS